MLLWLWCRLAAAVSNRPLAWEPPYASGAALKWKKKKKKKKRRKNFSNTNPLYLLLRLLNSQCPSPAFSPRPRRMFCRHWNMGKGHLVFPLLWLLSKHAVLAGGISCWWLVDSETGLELPLWGHTQSLFRSSSSLTLRVSNIPRVDVPAGAPLGQWGEGRCLSWPW